MALVKYGGVISELRGKEAGVIFSRNAYGAYMKQKVTPVNPQTQKQLAQRALMGNLAQSWAGLTEAQKASWVNLGEQTTRVNVFGDTTYYTGFSLFMKLNRNVSLLGGSLLTSAPVVDQPEAAVFTSLTAAAGTPALSLAFSPTVVGATKMFVYATNNILTGRSFVKNYYRLIAKVASAETSPYDLLAEWLAYFTNPLVEGARIFVKIKSVEATGGWESVPDTGSGVVAA